jgi:hypothetical protein
VLKLRGAFLCCVRAVHGRYQAKCSHRHPCSRCFERCVPCIPSEGPPSVPYLHQALPTLDTDAAAQVHTATFMDLHACGRMDPAALKAWM